MKALFSMIEIFPYILFRSADQQDLLTLDVPIEINSNE